MRLIDKNIQQLNNRLKKVGINYVDIRFELIDHFAEELNEVNGNFEDVFETYFQSKKKMINEIMSKSIRMNFGYGSRYLIKQFLSLRFIITYITTTILIYILTVINGKQSVLETIDILPLVIPAPISIAVLYQFFIKKQFVRNSMSILFAVNNITLLYLLLGIHLVRNIENSIWLHVFSLFMSFSFYSYYIYFQTKKENKKFFKIL